VIRAALTIRRMDSAGVGAALPLSTVILYISVGEQSIGPTAGAG